MSDDDSEITDDVRERLCEDGEMDGDADRDSEPLFTVDGDDSSPEDG